MISIDRLSDGSYEIGRYEDGEDVHVATLNADDYQRLVSLVSPDPYDESLVPGHTRESLDAYARTGRPVGSFLEAVLAHDLFEAANRADTGNARALVAIVSYVYNRLPAGSHGSTAKYHAWLRDAEAQRAARAWAESKVL